MNKIYQRSLWLLTIAALAFPAAASAEEFDLSGSATIGFQDLDIEDDGANFEQYGDVPDEDLVLEQIDLFGEMRDWYFDLEGRDFTQEDQYIQLEGGRWGKYKVRLLWDETFHNLHDGVFLGSQLAPGYWAVPDIIQQSLEPQFPLGGSPTVDPTAAGRAILQDTIDHAGNVDLRVDRDKGEIGFTASLVKDFTFRANYMHEGREGLRAMSSGSYRRDSTGAALFGGVGENFTLYGLEFPEPIDYNTDEISAGFNYLHDFWHVDFGYQYTSFQNDTGTVTWENPLRFTSVNDLQGGAALNLLDLYPDSTSHALNLNGGVHDLPLNSTITATASWDRITQDDSFPAFTVNRAVLDENGAIAADRSLPASNLNGEVTKSLFDIVLNSRPIDPLALNLRYNYYDYDNDSDKIPWEGWVRIAESDWIEEPHFNLVPAWNRTRAGLDASYALNTIFSLKADYLFEQYDRNEDMHADTEENIFGAGVQADPLDWMNFRLAYHRGERDIDGTYESSVYDISKEWELARMFDQAERDRDKVEAFATLTPTEKLTTGFSFKYLNDDYAEGFYGLQEYDSFSGGVDINYMISERISIFGYYTREDGDTFQRDRTKSDAAGGGSFAVPQNDWNTDIDDVIDTVGAGFELAIIPDRLTLAFDSNYSNGESEIVTTNPNYLAGVTTSGATAQSWPVVETEMTELKADLNYNLTTNWIIGLHYLYAEFNLDDFAVDLVEPYGIPADFMGNELSYFLFMDANYTDYKVHLVSATLSYSF